MKNKPNLTEIAKSLGRTSSYIYVLTRRVGLEEAKRRLNLSPEQEKILDEYYEHAKNRRPSSKYPTFLGHSMKHWLEVFGISRSAFLARYYELGKDGMEDLLKKWLSDEEPVPHRYKYEYGGRSFADYEREFGLKRGYFSSIVYSRGLKAAYKNIQKHLDGKWVARQQHIYKGKNYSEWAKELGVSRAYFYGMAKRHGDEHVWNLIEKIVSGKNPPATD